MPAILSIHRANFASGVDPLMRDRNLEGLDSLLSEIEKRHPDVLYLTSEELGEAIFSGEFRDFATGQKVPLTQTWIDRYTWFFSSKKITIAFSLGCLVFLAAGLIFVTRGLDGFRPVRN